MSPFTDEGTETGEEETFVHGLLGVGDMWVPTRGLLGGTQHYGFLSLWGALVGPGAAIGLTPQSRNRPMPIFAQAICPFCLSQLWLLSAFFSHSTPVPCAVPAKLSIPGKKHWQAGAQEGPGAEQA